MATEANRALRSEDIRGSSHRSPSIDTLGIRNHAMADFKVSVPYVLSKVYKEMTRVLQ